jgi:hypothetical protein
MHFRRSRCEPLQVLAPIASVGEATGLPLWEFRQRGQGEEHTEIITASTGLGQLNHASNGVSELRMLFAGCPSWPGTRSFADRPPGALLSLSHPQITAPGPEAELKNNGPSLDDSTGRPPPNGGCHLLHACIYIYIYPPEIVTPATKETAEALPLAPRLASEGDQLQHLIKMRPVWVVPSCRAPVWGTSSFPRPASSAGRKSRNRQKSGLARSGCLTR